MSCDNIFRLKHADNRMMNTKGVKNGSRPATKPSLGYVVYCPFCPVETFGGR